MRLLAKHALNPECRTASRKNFKDVKSFIAEPDSRAQCAALEENVKEFGLTYFGMTDRRQGIVHIIGPEQGFTLPGITCVCGDSHTSSTLVNGVSRLSSADLFLQHTAPLALWPSESVHPKSSTFLQPKLFSKRRRKTCGSR